MRKGKDIDFPLSSMSQRTSLDEMRNHQGLCQETAACETQHSLASYFVFFIQSL